MNPLLFKVSTDWTKRRCVRSSSQPTRQAMRDWVAPAMLFLVHTFTQPRSHSQSDAINFGFEHCYIIVHTVSLNTIQHGSRHRLSTTRQKKCRPEYSLHSHCVDKSLCTHANAPPMNVWFMCSSCSYSAQFHACASSFSTASAIGGAPITPEKKDRKFVAIYRIHLANAHFLCLNCHFNFIQSEFKFVWMSSIDENEHFFMVILRQLSETTVPHLQSSVFCFDNSQRSGLLN